MSKYPCSLHRFPCLFHRNSQSFLHGVNCCSRQLLLNYLHKQVFTYMLHISARSALYALDVPESSGAMNSGVPTSVMLPTDRAASPTLSVSLPRPSDVVENPRSHSLTLPSSPSRMFSSLRSLPERFAETAMKARHLSKLLVVDSLHTFNTSLSLSTLSVFPVWIFFQKVFIQ